MIPTLILILIYISFISLGLPDSLIGTSWPIMHGDLGADLSLLGSMTMVTSIGTIFSALFYTKISRFIKPGHLNCFCTFITGFCLLAISHIESLWLMFPVSLVLGLGAGSVDSCLNNYVAIHYRARHMNFLHACWGIGTIFGPTLLSMLFASGKSWRSAYVSVASVQLAIAALHLLTLKLWTKADRIRLDAGAEDAPQVHSIRKVLAIKGVKVSMFSTFLYCAIEAITFIWTASFMTVSRGYTESDAAIIVSMLYWGITMGRISSGFVSDRLGDNMMVLIGLCITLLAGIFFSFGSSQTVMMASGFFIGFGFGPVFPAILHQTPSHFGIENSSAIMGLQMSGAYVGSAFMPFLFGLGTKVLTPSYLPWMVLIFTSLEVWALFMRKKTFND